MIAALEGQEGVIGVEADRGSKALRVHYESRKVSAARLAEAADRMDIRLQARHRLRSWLGKHTQFRRDDTARIVSDEPA